MDEGVPKPKYSEDIQALIDRSLSGEISKLYELDNTIRKLCTVVDDTENIVAVVKALLRKAVEIHYQLDQGRDVEDQQYKPLTAEYEGDNIFKHPDAHEALETFLIYVQSEILDELQDAGKIDQVKRLEADRNLNEILEKPESDSPLLDTLENSGGSAGDAERQWRLVIQSFMNTTPKRDYHSEYVGKAYARWLEGVVTEKDLGLGIVDLVNFTADPDNINLLMDGAIQRNLQKRDPDTYTEREAETGILNSVRSLVGDMDKNPDVKRKNLRAWFQTVTQRMLNKKIEIDTGHQDV